jgi:hypothetical protein
MNSQGDSLMTRYLLGDTSESEKEEIERRLMVEPGFDEELDALEDQLIRDELRGELTSEERELFHRNLLRLPEANLRYQMLKALIDADNRGSLAVSPVPPTGPIPRPIKRHQTRAWLLTAAALVAAFFGGTQLAKRPAGDSVEKAAPAPVPAFVLVSGDARGSSNQPKRFAVPASASAVQLSVRFDGAGEYSAYDAVISSVDRDIQAWGRDNLQATGTQPDRSIALEVPAFNLLPGDYTLKLTGHGSGPPELIQGYSFSIVRP